MLLLLKLLWLVLQVLLLLLRRRLRLLQLLLLRLLVWLLVRVPLLLLRQWRRRRSDRAGNEPVCSGLGGRHAIPRRRPQVITWGCAAPTNVQADHVLHAVLRCNGTTIASDKWMQASAVHAGFGAFRRVGRLTGATALLHTMLTPEGTLASGEARSCGGSKAPLA